MPKVLIGNIAGPPGPQGPPGTGGGGGEAAVHEVRHDSNATYSYMGTAPSGKQDFELGWTVTRIALEERPPVITTATGSWDNRVALTYA